MGMKANQFAYRLGVLGTVIILVWVGLCKFTPTEAEGIKVYVSNHFAMKWMYHVMSVQKVSDVIGTFEIITGIGLFLSLFWPKIGKYAGLASMVIFCTTLSFIFTTPKSFHLMDGLPVTDFFLLKDIPYLAFSIMIYLKGREL
jgi:uncharacterized membrane protein YkgB